MTPGTSNETINWGERERDPHDEVYGDFVCLSVVSCPDPPNAPREKGSGQKGRTSVSQRNLITVFTLCNFRVYNLCVNWNRILLFIF